jgi:hypothetical protein
VGAFPVDLLAGLADEEFVVKSDGLGFQTMVDLGLGGRQETAVTLQTALPRVNPLMQLKPLQHRF